MTDYTPTTEQVLRNYQDGATTCGCCSYGDAEDAEKFNRWHRSELARAWDECIQGLAWCLDNGPPEHAIKYLLEHNPYRKATGDE